MICILKYRGEYRKQMKKLLWISPYVPYDSVEHAGGKNHNYYIKYFYAQNLFDIDLLTLAHRNQIKKIDLDEYGIHYYAEIIEDDMKNTLIRYIYNIESEYSPFNKYCGVFSNYQRAKLLKLIEKYAKEHSCPDIIILQWTQTVLLLPIIKKYFSKSKIVSIEEDVVFLAYERKKNFAKNFFARQVWKYKQNKIKQMELKELNNSELVVVNNMKDKNLLLKEGFDARKVYQGAIYFDRYDEVIRKVTNRNVIFYGAMKRKENYLSAIWFIKNVVPIIKDLGVTLLVIGSGGKKVLGKYADSNVKILDYVDDLIPFFSESIGLVAPLVLGAGIKVKVLEAFSAGLPVMTNSIGIEGIMAIDGKEYFHCETPEEYKNAISKLLFDKEEANRISQNERLFIQKNFQTDSILNDLCLKINSL